MQIKEFKSIISTFADPGSEMLIDKAKAVISVNGELIEIGITVQVGDVFVNDGSGPVPASKWIVQRLAKLSLLAARLKECVGETKMFVSPSALLLPSLEIRPEDTLIPTNDALNTMLQALDDRSPLETTILYITSDAGEGKTYLINQMAKEQAGKFTEGKSDWLLVPIPLGGKHFLRFDDITVGALQNRYRFPYLYYDSFLALVQMGVIVPAFDGFEEMFVESSSGEALSAMGVLVNALDSRGSLVIAARKAYFEFENLKTQEKLYDTISKYSVGFGKLELKRWGRDQFLLYCDKRGIANASDIYRRVSERLGEEHSLLTRPVLVRRLVDIAIECPSLKEILGKVEASGADYFSVFVRGIIDREANEKWIDRSGEKEMGTALLSVNEHCELLSEVALATWDARVDYLKRDHLEFVTDYFSEIKHKGALQSQQIRERIRGHALLISSSNAVNSIEFDHEEFRLFFLGEGLASKIRPMNDKSKGEALAIFRKGVIPKHAQLAFVRAIKRDSVSDQLQVARFILEISALDGQASYTQENCAWLVISLLSDVDARQLEVRGLAFPPDALRDRKITNVEFKQCIFAQTSMELSEFHNCSFSKCAFEKIRIYQSTVFEKSSFDSCKAESIFLMEKDIELWDPVAVQTELERRGVLFSKPMAISAPNVDLDQSTDQQMRSVEKVIRYFIRSTHISESVILIRLGGNAKPFIDETLPVLVQYSILIEIANRSAGVQRRFKLGKTLEKINNAIRTSGGSFVRFLDECNRSI
jgi:hypothetical protein